MTKQQKIEDLKRQQAQLAEEIAQLEAEPESGPNVGEPVFLLCSDGAIGRPRFMPNLTHHRAALAAGNLFWGLNAERDARYVADRRKNHEAKCPPPFKERQAVWTINGDLDHSWKDYWNPANVYHQAMYHARLVFATKEEAESRRMELKEGK